MKRSLLTVIIVIAILSGMPEAFRQIRAARESGSAWLNDRMFEGIINSTSARESQPATKRCEPAADGQAGVKVSTAGRPEAEFQLIG